MQKVLIISPISIAGELILRGFKSGFDSFGLETILSDVRELNQSHMAFNPDVILSYDFGYMILEDSKQLVQNYIKQNPKVRLIHYFADNPNLNYAHSGNSALVDEFYDFCKKHKNVELVFWDKKYLNSFPCAKSSYFPICVDCDTYKDWNLPKEFDITFVGRPLGQLRQRILSEVVKNFGEKLKIFSYPKHFQTSIEQMKEYLNEEELDTYKNSFCGFIKDTQELSKIYNKSKINLNINLQGENSLNLRTFEVLSSGGFLLSDRDFLNNECQVKYENDSDLIDKITYYLNCENERTAISARARKLIFERYNIKNKAIGILNIAE